MLPRPVRLPQTAQCHLSIERRLRVARAPQRARVAPPARLLSHRCVRCCAWRPLSSNLHCKHEFVPASHDRNATLTQPRTALLDTRRPQARWLDAVRSNRRRCAQRAVWWQPSSHSASPDILGRPQVSWDPADLEIDPQRYRFSMSPGDFENQTGKISTRHEARLEHDQRHCPARISILCTMVPPVILQSAVLRK